MDNRVAAAFSADVARVSEAWADYVTEWMTIDAIDLDERRAFMSDGHDYPITHMYDGDGHETNEPEDAASFIVEAHPVAWWCGAVRNFGREVSA